MKTLAKTLPYGQCALRTALNRIQAAGHLRRGRERATAGDGDSRWITRSWWSRTARDDGWWVTFVRGHVPQPDQPPAPAGRPTRSRAHILLAALGRTVPVPSLSAAECVRLAPLVEEWFARGATEETLLAALTAGLPTPVHSPAALLHRRLTEEATPWSDTRGALMAVEITSHDRDTDQRDRIDTPLGYAVAEIPVYLLIDRDNNTVVVHSEPKGGRHQQCDSYPWGGTVPLPAPVGVTLDTEELKDYAG
ncbi:Uma2 family endonuclease [Streptomyces sp. NPDC001388]|uniref:Uma2 family endonuclease n=1 Tax=Streptomyces sp. NPDC001388 TaxID=3364568 RepID=UPI00369C890A